MKFLFIILCLATSNLVIAGSFDYQGIHGKISNLSNFENQNLVVRASICGVSRRSPCEKKFEIESQVSAEGDYQLRNQKLSCRSCRRFRVIHYIQDTLSGKQKELFSYRTGNEMYKTLQNFTLFRVPDISASLPLAEGGTLLEWLRGPGSPFGSILFKAYVVNGDQKKTWLKKTLSTNQTLDGNFEAEYFPMFVEEGNIEIDSNLKLRFQVSTHSEENIFFQKEVSFANTDEILRQSLDDLNIDLSHLSQDINGEFRSDFAYETRYQKVDGWLRRVKTEDMEDRVRLISISTASFTCEENLSAEAILNFEFIGTARLSGTCNESGQAEFSFDEFLTSSTGVGMDLRGWKFMITKTIDGLVEAKVLDTTNTIVAHYKLVGTRR